MATTKIATLLIRTIAKPISAKLKNQARDHETFRSVCVSLAQFMYRYEVKLRTNILGESPAAKHLRPLSEAKAIDSGANALAEGFLFLVALGLILGETYRSSRKEDKRREGVTDSIETLLERVVSLEGRLGKVLEKVQQLEEGSDGEEGWEGVRRRNDELERVLQRVVEIGLRGGWAEFKNHPIEFPLVDLRPNASDSPLDTTSSSSISSTSTSSSSSSLPSTREKSSEAPSTNTQADDEKS
ncbi:optic atrophy 3 protein-domain-containing protein [Crepidotus variabilis]|uniref:Optic atrophy 3 protein-domain-containing protein n=1 Tax=Crepidotus variabilis TaxID=179855 RepID=A0A9P6JVR0_9AGAR|nr:optic atrophy 3 protein-domain-containing protein [Crepidotus variabilis]